jgi:hypothetical protein
MQTANGMFQYEAYSATEMGMPDKPHQAFLDWLAEQPRPNWPQERVEAVINDYKGHELAQYWAFEMHDGRLCIVDQFDGWMVVQFPEKQDEPF